MSIEAFDLNCHPFDDHLLSDILSEYHINYLIIIIFVSQIILLGFANKGLNGGADHVLDLALGHDHRNVDKLCFPPRWWMDHRMENRDAHDFLSGFP
jgi:hypothetical protein